jgi:signal peptidase II
VTKRRARVYDGLVLLLIIIILVLDQWSKALVAANLTLSYSCDLQIHLIGQYLGLCYIQNNGAAFSLFANSIVLVILIVAAVAIISILYARMLNNGSLAMKLIFGMIIGGALGNLIDRARHAGYVVDFISFRIPQIGFYFAIFNIADASISVGVFLLFVAVLLGSFRRPRAVANTPDAGTIPGDKQEDSLKNQPRSTPLT